MSFSTAIRSGPTGFALPIASCAMALFFAVTTLTFFVAGLFRGTALFSQMAEPSQPGPNPYGPNPFEVQQ